jgi:methionyl aminopeptidase
MTFTIEPMINAGRRDVRVLDDGWTVVTRDQSLSAQWEHTILVTDRGYEVLTLSAAALAAAGLGARLLGPDGAPVVAAPSAAAS